MLEQPLSRSHKLFELGQEGNKITFSGDFHIHDVRRVFAKIHDLINNKKYKNLKFDFSRVGKLQPSSMLPLCASIMQLNQIAKIETELILPDFEPTKKLFINTGWANIFEPRLYLKPQIPKTARNIPLITYKTPDEQEKSINEVLEWLLETVPNFDRKAFAAVEWALNEITDNVLNHSDSQIGGLLQLWSFDVRSQKIEFTICDAGNGVPNTLRSINHQLSDIDTLMEAVKSGVTRNPNEYQGNGLYGTLEICRAGGGKFSLNSGYAALLCQDGAVSTKAEKIPFTGTCIDAHIDFSEPHLLEKALSINGKIHKPVDYIELKYEQFDLKNIIFSLQHQGFSFRSRIAGKPIRTKLLNLLQQCEGQVIHVDFFGIPVVSSSFADEVFGKLFQEIGPMRFMQSIKLQNTSPTIQALIDRAIVQRMQNPSSSIQ